MLKDMLDIWVRAVTPGLKPDKAVVTYQTLLQEEDNPTLVKPLIWMVISGLITGAIHGLLSPILVAIMGESISFVLLGLYQGLAI